MRLNLSFNRKKEAAKDENFLVHQIANEARAKLMQRALSKGANAGNIIMGTSSTPTASPSLKDALASAESDLFNGN